MRYWLSYDLGLQGEFDQLFGWLDRQQAKECGDNVATFQSEKTRSELTRELLALLDLKRNPRIYIISMKQGGKWICGKRKVAPWTGYGQVLSEGGDERDE
jgi:uncharacterized protein with PhoU and TrkA domain